MQWQYQYIVALVIGTLIILFPVAFIWYINIGGIYGTIKMRRVAKLLEKALPNLTCSINADCPEGHVCVNGHCVPQKA